MIDIQELRSKLSARGSTSNNNTQRDSAVTNGKSNEIIRDTRGHVKNDERGTSTISGNDKRTISDSGTSQQEQRGTSSNSANTQESSALERYNKISKRFNRGNKKATEQPQENNIFVASSVITEKEAEEKEIKLTKALGTYFLYLDEYLWEKSGDTLHRPIWSSADLEELGCIARCFIKMGMKDRLIAQSINMMTDSNDFIVAGMFGISRTAKTYNILFPNGLIGRKHKR